MTYEHKRQAVCRGLSGVGGWAGIGLAAGLTDPHRRPRRGRRLCRLAHYTALGGELTVFPLPKD